MSFICWVYSSVFVLLFRIYNNVYINLSKYISYIREITRDSFFLKDDVTLAVVFSCELKLGQFHENWLNYRDIEVRDSELPERYYDDNDWCTCGRYYLSFGPRLVDV